MGDAPRCPGARGGRGEGAAPWGAPGWGEAAAASTLCHISRGCSRGVRLGLGLGGGTRLLEAGRWQRLCAGAAGGTPPGHRESCWPPARALLREVWLWGGCDRCVPQGCCSLPGLAGAVPRTGSELFPACSLPGQQGPRPRPHWCHFCLRHSLGSVLPHSTWEPVRQTSIPGLCSQSKNLPEPRSGEAHRGEERQQCVQQLWCISAGGHGGSRGQQEPPGCSARPAPLRRLRCTQLHRSHTLHRFTKNIG